MMWATSAPSYRSRSITNAFDQSVSSGGQSRTGSQSTSASAAWANHPSSIGAAPFPEL